MLRKLLTLAALLPVGSVALAQEPEKPLVQVAILLDTSGSMDGMISQARTQLWSIVNEFATAKQSGQRPILQVSLYQYGTPSLGQQTGYIRQILPLTEDLDKVSEELFKLTTDGGDEYCGMVIQKATLDLKWSPRKTDYKAIFIAGNETFAQGPVDYHVACKEAIAKGIIVNTIHCAGAENTFWADAAALADGRYMDIDGSKAVVEVSAPQDQEIAAINARLNATYLPYGAAGAPAATRQAEMDKLAGGISSANLASRAAAKSQSQYRNSSWDLVDAVKEKKLDVTAAPAAELPEEMRNLTPDQRKAYVDGKAKERQELQAKVQTLANERNAYVAEQMKKEAANNKDTLGEQIRNTVRQQAAKQSFSFE